MLSMQEESVEGGRFQILLGAEALKWFPRWQSTSDKYGNVSFGLANAQFPSRKTTTAWIMCFPLRFTQKADLVLLP